MSTFIGTPVTNLQQIPEPGFTHGQSSAMLKSWHYPKSKVLYWQAGYAHFLPDTAISLQKQEQVTLYLCFIICNVEGRICSKAVLEF